MSKTLTSAMQTHVAGRARALVFAVVVTRRDSTVFGWTQGDDATVTVDGSPVDLVSMPGFNVQSLVSTAGFDVDNTKVQASEGDITRAEVLARRWDGAKVYFFRYNRKDTSAGIIPVKRGSFGNFKPKLALWEVEFRDLRQALQANSTWVLQEDCRWRLGDARCRKDLTAFTFTGVAVTSVASQYTFTASSLSQAADYFGEGELTWLTGNNAGCRFKIKTHATGGALTLSEFAIFNIQIGDSFEIVAGCRKRFDPDCKTKFSNALNFGGEKDKPTRDELVAPASYTEL